MTITRVLGKNAPPFGVAPSIILVNPKFAHNVGMVLRVASCYGIQQLWFTGGRISLDSKKGKRLPREERMRMVDPVQLINCDYPFDAFPRGTTPVAVEIQPQAESLPFFTHPPNAVYVFGPEDGTIGSSVKRHCHHFLQIPSRHCFNLAVAVSIVIYDRVFKGWQAGTHTWPTLAEDRGLIDLEGILGIRNKELV